MIFKNQLSKLRVRMINLKKHILVVSQYFYPEQFRINDISKEWVKRGYKVTVVTGIPNYPAGKFFEGFSFFKNNSETIEGINVIRLPIFPRGNNSIMLVLNYLSFVISGFFWQLFSKVEPDLVFIFEVSPMTQALPGIWFAKKKKIPAYIYVQDLWPENVEIITGVKNKIIINGIGKMVDYIYKHCKMIFTTSESFVESIVDRNISEEKVFYWPQYAEDFYIPLEGGSFELIDQSKFNITFTGNVGQGQGLDILVQSAEMLKEKYQDLKIKFNIVGDGRYKDQLVKNIEKSDVRDYFNFIPKQSPKNIPAILASSQVAFLSLNKHPIFSKTIPAKLQSYMACGKPVLASAEGETEKIILDANCGICTAPGDALELTDAIITLYYKVDSKLIEFGLNSRLYYDSHFGKERLMDDMDRYFSNEVTEEQEYVYR